MADPTAESWFADVPDDIPCPHCGSSATGITDFGPGPETFKTGNGDATEPTSIVLTFRCDKYGGEFEREIPVA